MHVVEQMMSGAVDVSKQFFHPLQIVHRAITQSRKRFTDAFASNMAAAQTRM
jgi:hypothetical protein